MAEEIRELIEKIQSEGVAAAEAKAKAIEDEARAAANHIIEKAKKDAEKIVAEAKEKAVLTEESAKAALKQSARDLIISLRKEISAMLDRVITSHVHKALAAEELAGIITTIVKEAVQDARKDIVITLKKEDLEKLEKGFLAELRADIKKRGIILRASDDMQGGFMISYDSDKSYYDFTDKTLARHISFQLRPMLARILNEEIA
jgi:V/A-type H+-transporting ATPase subunit E